MFGTTWTIARVRGIDLRIDVSWTLIAVLIAYSLYVRIDALYEGIAAGEAVALALAAAAAFFASVVLHELAHALTALARGITVESITLFLFGGATAAKVDSKGPKEEFAISIVGPLTSAAIGVVLFFVARLAGPIDQAVPGTIGYLSWVNFGLAVFNLLPGLPLDGGRVFRSIMWGVTGDLHRATRIAAGAGKAIGYSLLAVGVVSLLSGAGGLWLAFIGWFLASAAGASYAELELRRVLSGATAGDVMATSLVTVPAGIDLGEAVDRYVLREPHAAFPVLEDGAVAGLLTLGTIRSLSPAERADRSVRDVMVPVDAVVTVRAATPLQDVVERLSRDDHGRALVIEDGQLRGLVTTADVTRWLQRRQERERRVLDLTSASEGGAGRSTAAPSAHGLGARRD